MHWRHVTSGLAAALLLVSSLPAAPPGKEGSSFSTLRAADPAEARKQADAWLKSVGKTDAATQAAVKKIWEADRPLLDKVSATICLGDAEAAKVLAAARDEDAPAPTEVPAILKDAKKSGFYRSNLALAYGKALAQRKVYEEGLEALLAVKADDVVDPAAYFFHKAVCELSLMLKESADQSIDRLLVDVTDSPERYRQVASHMHFEMLTWKEKDLGWIARKMDSIQRRLDLARGGKHTQKMQKEVLVRLDEMIKELENQQKNSGGS